MKTDGRCWRYHSFTSVKSGCGRAEFASDARPWHFSPHSLVSSRQPSTLYIIHLFSLAKLP